MTSQKWIQSILQKHDFIYFVTVQPTKMPSGFNLDFDWQSEHDSTLKSSPACVGRCSFSPLQCVYSRGNTNISLFQTRDE